MDTHQNGKHRKMLKQMYTKIKLHISVSSNRSEWLGHHETAIIYFHLSFGQVTFSLGNQVKAQLVRGNENNWVNNPHLSHLLE